MLKLNERINRLEEENKKKTKGPNPNSKSVFGAFKNEWMPELRSGLQKLDTWIPEARSRFEKLEQIIKKQKKQ